MVKKILKKYFNLNFYEPRNAFPFLKIKMLIFFSLLISFYLIFFAGYHFLNQLYFRMKFDLLLLAICLGNLFFFKKKDKVNINSSVLLILILIIIIDLMINGRQDQAGIFCLITFPILSFSLKGIKSGLFWLMSVYVIIFSLTILHHYTIIRLAPPFNLVVILVIFTFISLFAYYYQFFYLKYIDLIYKNGKISKEFIDKQFLIAEKIQRSLIPQNNLLSENLEISGYYQSAFGVGGDYFDYFEIENHKAAIIICDVSGKGIPAALLMVIIRTVFHTFIKNRSADPAKIFCFMNKIITRDFNGKYFATMFFLVFDHRNRKVTFCNAGHSPFYYYCSREKEIREIYSHSLPIGISIDKAEYENVSVKLEKGDILFLMTDGITEANSNQLEVFGKEGVFERIKKYHQLPAVEINQKIIKDLYQFIGNKKQNDDISFIIAKVR